MGKITAIKKHAKASSRQSVHVDGEQHFTCDSGLISRLGLEVGDIVDNGTLAELRHADEFAAATAEAVRILGRRARSKCDLTSRLQAKEKFTDKIISETIAWVEEKGFLNDAEYVSDRISSLTGAKRMGRAGIVAKLIAEGIDPQLAREQVDDAVSLEREQQWACELAALKTARMVGKDWQAVKRSISSLLHRRGFEADLVWTIITNLDMPYDE